MTTTTILSPERAQELGNELYPLIAQFPEVVDAGKVTGMLLESCDEAALVEMLTDENKLGDLVSQAVGAMKEQAVTELMALLKVYDNLEEQSELSVPWESRPDGISTGVVPVLQAVNIHAVLTSPLSLPFTASVHIAQPASAPADLAGTLNDTCNAIAIGLKEGDVCITITLGSAAAVVSHGYSEPPLGDLRQLLNRKRSERSDEGGAAAAAQLSPVISFESDHFDVPSVSSMSVDDVCAFILKTLGEPNKTIGAAVVESLGVSSALYLLHLTLDVQRGGGMAIEHEGGRLRTAGGVYVKLLRECEHVDRGQADAAWKWILKVGADEKKKKRALAERKHRERGSSDEYSRSSPSLTTRPGRSPLTAGRHERKHALPLSATPVSKINRPSQPAVQTPLALELEFMSES